MRLHSWLAAFVTLHRQPWTKKDRKTVVYLRTKKNMAPAEISKVVGHRPETIARELRNQGYPMRPHRRTRHAILGEAVMPTAIEADRDARERAAQEQTPQKRHLNEPLPGRSALDQLSPEQRAKLLG